MRHSKSNWIVGGGIGLFACIGIAISFLRPESGPSLQGRIDQFFDHDRQTIQSRYENIDGRMETLRGFLDDTRFSQLKEEQRQEVITALGELRGYQTYARQLAEIAAPSTARTQEQLHSIQSRLNELVVPREYQLDWLQTEPGRRHHEWLDDARTLDRAVYETRRYYHLLRDQGESVLKNLDAPQLPRRAQDVLDDAKRTPMPERDEKRSIPGSTRLTYATVFQFTEVNEVYRAWEKVRKELEPLTLSRRPGD
jgi:hypothetical protein